MKFLFVNTNIGYGGASKIMVWVANLCSRSGHDVTFLTYRDDQVRQTVDKRVNIVHVQLEHKRGWINTFSSIKWLHRFIKLNSFDIGIAFLSPSILRLAFAAKGTDMKVVFSHRSDPYFKTTNYFPISKIVNLLNNYAFHQADGYVFQTKMAWDYYGIDIKNKSVVIPNPINPMRRTKDRLGNVRKSFVAVGRLDLKQKRQDLLIDAFNIISPRYPEFKLEIFGDGEDELKIKELAASNPNILLMGKTSDVAVVIENAWATVLSSDFEGIPNVLLESMSLGVPTISTDCSPGGAAMLIRNKENGLLVPRGDSKSLADAMEFMINHPEEAEAMGQVGKEVGNLYAENKIGDMWTTFFQTFK